MLLSCLFAIAVLASQGRASEDCPDCVEVTADSPVLDCLRIRSVNMRRLVYGTGYFTYGNAHRYLGVWREFGTPFNSAFRLERIPEFVEPLYYIRMINTKEYLEGGTMLSATHENRVPVFSYHARLNATSHTDGVWVFEKAYDVRGAFVGTWHIKNLYYDSYWIASYAKSDPPVDGTSFWALKLDRRNQPQMGEEHQFSFEQCG